MTAHFLVHVCYGQRAGWIKIPLGTEVGLGPGDIVLDGDPPPPRKGAQQPRPLYGPLLWPASPQARILPMPVLSTRQCAADGSRGNPTG